MRPTRGGQGRAPPPRPHPPWEGPPIARQRYSPRRLSYAALLIAAGLTGVYAETIPNFEVLTLVVFCSGVLLGARDGALVGTLTMLVFSLLNPYGPAHPVITAAQVAGNALSGVAGAVFARLGGAAQPTAKRAILLALCAVLLTAFYDLVTNVATGLVYGQMRVWLVGGIPFALWHIGYNVALFVALGTPLVAVFAR
ncbi:MAG TPA: hypothetical protein VJY35_15425, partial [Candidatus Eisenbacteria bacterium]|nr:hypothetical protein [Candidatus Eisenbacteria bacterium]